MVTKEYYKFHDYLNDINHIASELKNKKVHFVSIYRGSLAMGVFLSNRLNAPLSIVKFQTYDDKDKEVQIIFDAGIKDDETIVILDDIGDTYNTLKKVEDYYSKRTKNDIVSYTLYGKKNLAPKNSKYYREHTGKWIVFEHNGEV